MAGAEKRSLYPERRDRGGHAGRDRWCKVVCPISDSCNILIGDPLRALLGLTSHTSGKPYCRLKRSCYLLVQSWIS